MSRTDHILTLTEVIAAVSSAALRARGTAALKALVESSLDVSPPPGTVDSPSPTSKAAARSKRYRESRLKRDGERDGGRDASRSSVTEGVTGRDVERDAVTPERDENRDASRSERDENVTASRPVTVGSRSLSSLSLDLEIEKIAENQGDQRESLTRAPARESVTGRDERDAVTLTVTPLGSPCAEAVYAEVERQMGLGTQMPEGRAFLARLDRVRLAREIALIADKSPVSLAVQVTEELCKAAVVSLPTADPWTHERVHEKARTFVMSAERKRRQETSRRPADVRAMGRQDQRDPAKTAWMQEPKEAK